MEKLWYEELGGSIYSEFDVKLEQEKERERGASKREEDAAYKEMRETNETRQGRREVDCLKLSKKDSRNEQRVPRIPAQ
jgi:hypothetical protein